MSEHQTHHYGLRVEWTGAADGATVSYGSYSRDHEISGEGKPRLPGSADAAFRGDCERYSPEDLLVAALSACHMLSYLAICARAGIPVVSYVDEARGTMSMHEGKMRFTEVTLQPVVTIANGNLETALEMHERAHAECFIANSVNFPVRHEASVERFGASPGTNGHA